MFVSQDTLVDYYDTLKINYDQEYIPDKEEKVDKKVKRKYIKCVSNRRIKAQTARLLPPCIYRCVQASVGGGWRGEFSST